MASSYLGLSITLSAFLLVVLCVAFVWLALDSRDLWKQFRHLSVLMRPGSPEPSDHAPANGERSGLRLVYNGGESVGKRALESGPAQKYSIVRREESDR